MFNVLAFSLELAAFYLQKNVFIWESILSFKQVNWTFNVNESFASKNGNSFQGQPVDCVHCRCFIAEHRQLVIWCWVQWDLDLRTTVKCLVRNGYSKFLKATSASQVLIPTRRGLISTMVSWTLTSSRRSYAVTVCSWSPTTPIAIILRAIKTVTKLIGASSSDT